MMNQEEKKKEAYRLGVVVLILLGAMTVIEYLIGYFAPLWWSPLLGIAALKAFFIIRDYMHIGRVFAKDEEEVHS
jgi:cytochrome c oxidase subunit IV